MKCGSIFQRMRSFEQKVVTPGQTQAHLLGSLRELFLNIRKQGTECGGVLVVLHPLLLGSTYLAMLICAGLLVGHSGHSSKPADSRSSQESLFFAMRRATNEITNGQHLNHTSTRQELIFTLF